jgi:uncharacterized protein
MTALALWILRIYKRWISPLFPPSCCYVPTCSEYAMEAVEKFGALRGGFMAIGRLLRCHPFVKGGYDPVPAETARSPRNGPIAAINRCATQNLRTTND